MDKIYKRRGGNSVIDDPYLQDINYGDPNICPECGAIYHNKRWKFDEDLKREIQLNGNYGEKKCPACRKKEDDYPMGLVFVSGNFIQEHREDIINTVKGEEKRAIQKNPLERIISVEKENENQYIIKTTTDTLAHRIGNILHKSYNGEVEYKFSEDHLRVFWSREV